MIVGELIDSMLLTLVTPVEGSLGSRLRYLYYRGKLKHCGGYFTSAAGFNILECDKVSIGSGCGFNRGVFISASNSIEIGDNAIIGAFSILRDSEHGYSQDGVIFRKQPLEKGSIFIKDNVWLGAHCIVLDGSRIGNDTVVGANSLVKIDLGSGGVWVGSPARRLR